MDRTGHAVRWQWLVLTVVAGLCTANVTMAREERTGADPTDFITRYEPSFEFREFDSGDETAFYVLRADLALRRDMSLRIDVPVLDYEPGNRSSAAGLSGESGLGDIVSQIIYKPISDGRKAAIVGLRVDWDTSAEGELGRGGNMYSPLGAVSWAVKPGLMLIPILRWNLGSDLDNDPLPGKRDLNELSYRQLVLWQPGHPLASWMSLDPELIVDFEDDEDATLTLGVEWGKMIKPTVGEFVKPTVELTDDTTDWGIKVGLRRMFPTLVAWE